jgi:UDP-N-acetylglucosamine 2-epimerase
MRTPCVTVRDETEWLETVESGWNVLVGADADRILAAAAAFARASVLSDTTAAQVGASALIVRELEAFELPARS